MDQKRNKIVKALARADMMFTITGTCPVFVANMVNKRPMIIKSGAPGGCPTCRVKAVVINYIKNKKSFCDNQKFKKAEIIFDGLLQFLYNNRQTYVDAVFQLKKQFGINAEIDVLRPFLGRIPIPFAVTIIKKVFFAEPGHLSGIYASIDTVIRDPAVAPYCSDPNSDPILFAKKLIRQIADKMKLPMKIKAALASESW